MSKQNLGRLERIDLREIWDSEAGSFTPWLAKPDNIALLGESLGMDLVVEHQEAGVGPYRADIVCRDQQSDRTVVIENQIEMTDHSHLGQLLTYAAGLDARAVVWVAREFASEHRAAMDWLNEKTGQGAAFFGVEVEVLRIGQSEPAPRFNVVSRPNDWQELMRREGAGLTDTERLRLEYWSALDVLLRKKDSPLRFQKVGTNYWQGLRTPVRGFYFGFEMSVRDRYIDVYFGSEAQESLLKLSELFAQKQTRLEAEIGAKLETNIETGSTHGYVDAWLDTDPRTRADWPRQHEWLRSTAEKFAEVFPGYLSRDLGGS
jgi:hypothetical protein